MQGGDQRGEGAPRKGGAAPLDGAAGELVLSLGRMSRVRGFGAASGGVTCEAGVLLEQRAAYLAALKAADGPALAQALVPAPLELRFGWMLCPRICSSSCW